MYIHEYLAKELLQHYGVAVPKSVHITSADEVENACATIGGKVFAVKAQVLSGARGKAGGIIICKNVDEVKQAVQKLLGSTLKTQQNAEGLPINSLLIEEGLQIDAELYISITINRSAQSIAIIASSAGGGDIEEVAAHHPEMIISHNIDIAGGLNTSDCATIAQKLAVDSTQLESVLQALYALFIEKNANLIEINPLIISNNTLIPLDCKIEFDDNALFKHKDIQALRDTSQENAKEIYAANFGLNYISIGGEIGCMVNGAGLAMATMDLIKHHGGTPANFLDVGGTTTADKVAKAFEIITSEVGVKSILINIFGGIVRCDLIAEGIIKAIQESNLTIPLVVRLEGTNAEIGLQLLNDSGLNVISENDLERATQKAVEVAK